MLMRQKPLTTSQQLKLNIGDNGVVLSSSIGPEEARTMIWSSHAVNRISVCLSACFAAVTARISAT